MKPLARFKVLSLRTPEGAQFSYIIASPLLRLCAVLIDFSVIMTGLSILSLLISLLNLVSMDLAGMVSILAYFVLSFGYDMVCEWRFSGKTLGKRLLRLRVVDASGMNLALSQILLRNIFRLVDVLPFGYSVGGLACLVNSRGQRLGDLAAGTLVIYEPVQRRPDIRHFEADKYNSLKSQAHVVARLRQAIPPHQAQAAWQALQRAGDLESEARVRLFADIAAQFRKAGHVPESLLDGIADEVFVRNVVEVLLEK